MVFDVCDHSTMAWGYVLCKDVYYGIFRSSFRTLKWASPFLLTELSSSKGSWLDAQVGVVYIRSTRCSDWCWVDEWVRLSPGGDVRLPRSYHLTYLKTICISLHLCLALALTFREGLFCNKHSMPAWHEQTSSWHSYISLCWVLRLLTQRCWKRVWLNGCFPIQTFVTAVIVFIVAFPWSLNLVGTKYS